MKNDLYAKHRNTFGFKTPQGYMEKSKNQMLNDLIPQPNRFKKDHTWLGMVASISLLIGVFWLQTTYNSKGFEPKNNYDLLILDSVSVEEFEFEEWFEEHYILDEI
ncbi:MAG: hypothetical protein ACON42_02970 [Flavobacteriaceae bacterium]